MKTKAQIVLFVLCFSFIKNKAQIYFNNRYDATGSFDGTNVIDTFQNKYLTVGSEGAYGTRIALSLYLFNLDGTINKKKTYSRLNENLQANYSKYLKKGTQFYTCGVKAILGYRTKAYLWRFDNNLDSVKYNEYEFPNSINWLTSIILNKFDNKIYLAGIVDDTLQTNRDILLIKTDTAGNEIWKKKIGITGWDESATTIDTIKNSLLIGGYKTPHGSNYYYGLVMRLDTAGNTIWQRTINTFGLSGVIMRKLKDGTILCCGFKKTNTIGTKNYGRFYLEKIDADNNLIWSKTIGEEMLEVSGVSSIIENKNNNIVIVGQKVMAGNAVNGIVYEVNQLGDSLFSREYSIMAGSQNYFRDVIQATDNGYCFAGFVTPIVAAGGTGTQDVWLLKVDSNFCENSVPCGYATGLPPLSKGEGLGVRLYPNPASSVLNIEFSSPDFVRDYMLELTENPITIQIINNLGQIVLTEKINSHHTKINIDNLKDGLYYLSLKLKDKTVTQKLIIQK